MARLENQRMQDLLRSHGILAVVKRIHTGSMKHVWRIYCKDVPWTLETGRHLETLGLRNYDNGSFSEYSGNGGTFQVFARGLDHLASPSPNVDL